MLVFLKYLVEWLTKIIVVGFPLYGDRLAGIPGLAFLRTETGRASATIAVFTTWFFVQARDAQATRVGVDEFLKEHIPTLDFGDISPLEWSKDLRLNVMYLRRVWWSAFLLKAFELGVGRKGFDLSQKGKVFADEKFYLLSWQGVAGAALRERRPKLAVLKSAFRVPPKGLSLPKPSWKIWTTLWLLPWQVRKTSHLKAILSVPMVNGKPSARIVGVINLDAPTKAGARYIVKNKEALALALAGRGRPLALLP